MSTSLNVVEQVRSLFTARGWPIDEGTKRQFDGFCELLQASGLDEQQMILDLSNDFIWVRFGQYIQMLAPAVRAAIAKIGTVRRIVFVPLLKKDDYGKLKSSNAITYFAKSELIERFVPHDIEKIILDTPESIAKIKMGRGDNVVALDDFIGTGKTCRKVIKEISMFAGVPVSVHVCVIFAMKEAISDIQSLNVFVHAKEVLSKGISSNPRLSDDKRRRYEEIMKRMEDQIKIQDKYRFGFEGSESLISFDRAPNNTFPIYWARHDLLNRPRGRPFSRI